MYASMYVDTETIPVEDHFPDTKTFAANYKKISYPLPLPKHLLVLSYKRSEDYELDKNFDDIEFKNN